VPILLSSTLRGIADLSTSDLDWLHQLIADWQVIADLSVSDLVLWARTATNRFVAVAHCRPSTGSTVHLEDVIGRRMPAAREAMAVEAFESAQILMATAPAWTGTTAVREEYVPVVRDGRAVAIMTRETSVGLIRGGRIVDKPLEDLADALCTMIAGGDFPIRGAGTVLRHGTPRVADGVLHLDEEGFVRFATPNARSCFHRLGIDVDVGDCQLAEAVTSIIPERTPVDETMAVVLMGRQAWLTEVEVGGVYLALRSIPLRRENRRAGAVLLVRDVTEIRRREQVLLNKDATIREIHHRVKNNLQTVSALLRMQGRRATNDETREALAEAANARQAACDPTAHAEVLALRAAGAALGDSHMDGCELVVTLEPCTMCAGAIQLARLVRVVFAVWEPKTGACGSVRDVLRDPRANHRVEVVAGVRERESEALLRRFFAERR